MPGKSHFAIHCPEGWHSSEVCLYFISSNDHVLMSNVLFREDRLSSSRYHWGGRPPPCPTTLLLSQHSPDPLRSPHSPDPRVSSPQPLQVPLQQKADGEMAQLPSQPRYVMHGYSGLNWELEEMLILEASCFCSMLSQSKSGRGGRGLFKGKPPAHGPKRWANFRSQNILES